jgi:hypothetical protein
MADLDWEDIVTHAVVAQSLGFLAAAASLLWPPLGLAVLVFNGLFWIGREAAQRIEKAQPMSRLVTEPQVVLEWGVPLLAAPLAFSIPHLF